MCWAWGTEKKKLIELGRFIAGNSSKAEPEHDNDKEVIQLSSGNDEYWQKVNTQRATDFDLWDENHEAYELFIQCQTQWNTSMAGITGLNYPAVESVMRMNAKSIEKQTELFELIRFIERGFLYAVSERNI